MGEHDLMFESFQSLYHQEKCYVLSKLGTPDISFQPLAVYKQNELWLVLLFEDIREEGSFHSLLSSAAFFDESLNLLWSSGIQLMPEIANISSAEYRSVDEFIEIYGEPHTEIGSGQTALLYLTKDGHMVFLKYAGNHIIELSQASLIALSEKFKEQKL